MSFEVEVALVGLGGVLVGSAISSITTILLHRSERNKFARERLWDARREAYTKIVGPIVRAARLSDHMRHEYETDPHGYDDSNEMREAAGQYIAHFHEAQDAFYMSRLLLSSAFAQEFEDLLYRLGDLGSNPNLIPPEKAEKTAAELGHRSKALMRRAIAEIEAQE